MITKEIIEATEGADRPEKISITYADGHVVEFLGEAARAMYRWQINGHALEDLNALEFRCPQKEKR